MGWADDMYEMGYTREHGGLMGRSSYYDSDDSYYESCDESCDESDDDSSGIGSISQYHDKNLEGRANTDYPNFKNLIYSKISDVEVVRNHHSHMDASINTIKFKLDAYPDDWIEIVSTDFLSTPNGVKLSERLERDESLHEIIGEDLYGALEVEGETLKLKAVFYIGLKEFYKEFITRDEFKGIASFHTSFPVYLMLKGDSKKYCRGANVGVSINDKEILRSDFDDDLYIIETDDHRTIFFRDFDDIKTLTKHNVHLVFYVFYKTVFGGSLETERLVYFENQKNGYGLKYSVDEEGISSKIIYFSLINDSEMHSIVSSSDDNFTNKICYGDPLPNYFSEFLAELKRKISLYDQCPKQRSQDSTDNIFRSPAYDSDILKRLMALKLSIELFDVDIIDLHAEKVRGLSFEVGIDEIVHSIEDRNYGLALKYIDKCFSNMGIDES